MHEIPSDLYEATALAEVRKMAERQQAKAIKTALDANSEDQIDTTETQIDEMVSEGGPALTDFSGSIKFQKIDEPQVSERPIRFTNRPVDAYGGYEPKYGTPKY